jgi:hypothetical protein
MEKFLQKLTGLLRKQFKGSESELEIMASGRVGGFLIWKGFASLDQIDRHARLWKVLSENLTEKERSKVSPILTMTPEEIAYARQD